MLAGFKIVERRFIMPIKEKVWVNNHPPSLLLGTARDLKTLAVGSPVGFTHRLSNLALEL